MKQLQTVPWVVTILKRERTGGNDVKFLETSQGYGQVHVCRYRYKHLLVTETRETMKAVDSNPYHTFPEVSSVRIRIPSLSRGKTPSHGCFEPPYRMYISY